MRWAFRHEAWNVGVVHQSAADIVAHGLTQPVRWLPEGPAWTFIADPMVRPEADGPHLYVERMDYLAGKGSIWGGPFRPETAGDQWARLSPLFEAPFHLSFPQSWPNGTARLTCEGWEAGGCAVIDRDGEGWRRQSPIMPDLPIVDPVLHHDGRRLWLFCTHAGPAANRDLYLYHADSPDGPWHAHGANPVVSNHAGARPAGPLFRMEDKLIRPAQDCSATYGGAVILWQITTLTPTTFEEMPVRRLMPLSPYENGLHTFCPAGAWTVIDGKRWRYHGAEPLRKWLVGRRNKARRAQLSGIQGMMPTAIPSSSSSARCSSVASP